MTFYIDDTDNAIGPGTPSHPVLMMDLNNNFPQITMMFHLSTMLKICRFNIV